MESQDKIKERLLQAYRDCAKSKDVEIPSGTKDGKAVTQKGVDTAFDTAEWVKRWKVICSEFGENEVETVDKDLSVGNEGTTGRYFTNTTGSATAKSYSAENEKKDTKKNKDAGSESELEKKKTKEGEGSEKDSSKKGEPTEERSDVIRKAVESALPKASGKDATEKETNKQSEATEKVKKEGGNVEDASDKSGNVYQTYEALTGGVEWRREKFTGITKQAEVLEAGPLDYLKPVGHVFTGSKIKEIDVVDVKKLIEEKIDHNYKRLIDGTVIAGHPVFAECPREGNTQWFDLGSWCVFKDSQRIFRKLKQRLDTMDVDNEPAADVDINMGEFKNRQPGEGGARHVICVSEHVIQYLNEAMELEKKTYEPPTAAVAFMRTKLGTVPEWYEQKEVREIDANGKFAREKRPVFDRVMHINRGGARGRDRIGALSDYWHYEAVRDESERLAKVVIQPSGILAQPIYIRSGFSRDDLKSILMLPSREDAARTFGQILSAELGSRGSVICPAIPESVGREHFIYGICWLLIMSKLEFLAGRAESVINMCYRGLALTPISQSPGAEYFPGGDRANLLGVGGANRETHREVRDLIENIVAYKEASRRAYPDDDEYIRAPVYINDNIYPRITAANIYDRHALSGAQGMELRRWITRRMCHDGEPSVARVLGTISPAVHLDLRVAESIGTALVYADYVKAHMIRTYPINPMSVTDYQNPQDKRGLIQVGISGAFAIIRHGIGNVEDIDETGTVRLASYVNRPMKPIGYTKTVLARGLSLKAMDDMKNLIILLTRLNRDFLIKDRHWLAYVAFELLKKRFVFKKPNVMLERVVEMAERICRRANGDVDVFHIAGSDMAEVREWLTLRGEITGGRMTDLLGRRLLYIRKIQNWRY